MFISGPVFLTYRQKLHPKKVNSDYFLFDAERKKCFLFMMHATKLVVTFDNTMCINVLKDRISYRIFQEDQKICIDCFSETYYRYAEFLPKLFFKEVYLDLFI